jgi:hypothetical protein
MVMEVEKKFLVLEHFSTPGGVINPLQLLKARMQPAKSALSFRRISNGSTQLFVGPAECLDKEQMNVRSSTRATSLGSDFA